MVSRDELLSYIDTLLESNCYQDYAPNGLQVEGKAAIHTLVSGVTANQALIEAALVMEADALLVHHGWFWRGEESRIIGMKQRRLKRLLCADVSLFAYHLPLDGHAELGNNARLGQLLDLKEEGRFGNGPAGGIACYGTLAQPMTLDRFAAQIGERLGRQPQLVAAGDHLVRRIGWCSGAAQDYLPQAAALGLDAYLSGEVSERTFHEARELGIHYISAGHHATERYGVEALGEHLAQHFGLSHRFIDIDNPI